MRAVVRVPETVVHDAVVVRDAARRHRVMVREGGGGEGRLPRRRHADGGEAVEERHLIQLRVVPAVAVQRDDHRVVDALAGRSEQENGNKDGQYSSHSK